MTYEDDDRGQIQNRARGQQLIDYRGIRYGNITPTDIDGFFEKGGKAFVFYEYKLSGARMPRGQELALTRLVDGLSDGGKSAVLFLCEHREYNPEQDIEGHTAIVEKIYWNGRWYKGSGKTAKEHTDKFMRWVETLRVA